MLYFLTNYRIVVALYLRTSCNNIVINLDNS